MVLLLFSHEYTWTILAIVMGIFLGVMLKLGYYKRRNAILLLVIILSTIIIDLARTTLIGLSNGFGRDIAVAYKTETGIGQFAQRWSNLKDTMQGHYGAQFSNFIILILCLYWLFRCNLRETSTILLVTFLSLGIVPVFFGNWVIQSRVLYDIPFQIPAALGLYYLRNQDKGVMILLPICVWLIAISVRGATNLFPS